MIHYPCFPCIKVIISNANAPWEWQTLIQKWKGFLTPLNKVLTKSTQKQGWQRCWRGEFSDTDFYLILFSYFQVQSSSAHSLITFHNFKSISVDLLTIDLNFEFLLPRNLTLFFVPDHQLHAHATIYTSTKVTTLLQ